MNKQQHGFSAVEFIVVVVVVGLLAFGGWWVYNRQNDEAKESQTTQTEQTAPEVNNASDLEQAENYVNQTDIDEELDTSEIDAALSE